MVIEVLAVIAVEPISFFHESWLYVFEIAIIINLT